MSFPPGSVSGHRRIRIGAQTMIGAYVSLAAGMADDGPVAPQRDVVIVIGDRCNIGRNSSIVGIRHIEIGDDVTTGPNVYITDHNHTYVDRDVPIARQWPSEAPVRIGPGCWLGSGAVVLPGATIGRNVVVAANAVVRGDVPDYAVVAGSPARIVRRWVDGEGWDPPMRDVTMHKPDGWDDD
jgi:tetrahydrodipicolinate N-succinyltransferase